MVLHEEGNSVKMKIGNFQFAKIRNFWDSENPKNMRIFLELKFPKNQGEFE